MIDVIAASWPTSEQQDKSLFLNIGKYLCSDAK
jgi:hypothetical protein